VHDGEGEERRSPPPPPPPSACPGSVWTSDPERGAAVAERRECGTSLVNAHSELGPDQPLVGAKWSGIGAEKGHWGLEGMTQLQVGHSART
jgi:acyl-CoA reductase-like NAD-dependent aldehyde dehydrogenase